MSIKYKWVPGNLMNREQQETCAKLYSEHYGTWGKDSPIRPGEQIRLSTDRLASWFSGGSANLYYAMDGDEMVGYAIAVSIKLPHYKPIVWVTQLVVHTDYRNRGIAKNILYSIWGMSNNYAWGLVTSNPFAVRALEKATRRRCDPKMISKKAGTIMEAAEGHVPYVGLDTPKTMDSKSAKLFTQFFAQHDDLAEKIALACKGGVPWVLGPLEEGWEWAAFTFQKQSPMDLSADEVEQMLERSDDIVRDAYSKMGLTSDTHAWARYGAGEVALIEKCCKISRGSSVIDIGCGIGRHSVLLAEHGAKTFGVDYVESSIEYAESQSTHLDDCEFECADILEYKLDQPYDAAICLYDVVGSYVDYDRNLDILSLIYRSLKPGGRAMLSVMNYALTEKLATHTFSFAEDPNRVLHIEASDTMARTGDIFNERYMLVDTEQHVVYRREQFSKVNWELPVELIVRDKRFTADEISDMCRRVGLKVLFTRFVHAGDWITQLDAEDPKAKEILLLLERPIAM